MADVEPNYGTLYRQKPIEVRAVKVNKNNLAKVARWSGGFVAEDGETLVVNHLRVPLGDYVVNDQDEFWAVGGEDFEFFYDEVEISQL